MEFSQKSSLPNPMVSASFLSRLTFWWLNPLFSKGYDRRLEPEDLYEVLQEDSSEQLVSDLESEWQKEQAFAAFSGNAPSFVKAMARFVRRSLIVVGLIGFLNEAVRTVQPILLFHLVSYFVPGSNVTKLEAYLYAVGVTLTSLLSVMLHQVYFFNGHRTGMKLRIAAVGCIYRKALRLSQGTYASITTGHVVNLISSDTQFFDQLVVYGQFAWITPIHMIITVYLLWTLLGVSCLVGLAVMLLMVLSQARLGKIFGVLRFRTARLADQRCKHLNEIFSGMRVVKISTWEMSFCKIIHHIRRSEIAKVWKAQFIKALNMALAVPSQSIVSFVTFTTYVLLGNTLTAAKVFSSIAFLNVVQRSVGYHFPKAIQRLSEAKITAERIKEFLELEELHFEGIRHKSNPRFGHCSVVAKSITASWKEASYNNPTLQDISFEVKQGDLLMVVGPVGCGKSSLLMAMLGELQISKGCFSIKGKIGYIPQIPWIFSGSVKQNIIFGQALEEERYRKVLKACALEQDVELLPEGDLTLVGEKGLALSGGQKSRIALARAVYYKADIYLLDDPLSAVDVRVGRQLFDECISGLIRECPRILVTHQLQYLRNASEIIYLEEGKVSGRGSFTELASSGIDLVSLLSSKEKDYDDDNDSAIDDDCEPAQAQVVLRRGNGARGLKAINRWSTVSSVDIEADLETMANKGEEKPLMEPEERPRGNIPFKLYLSYFRAGANCIVLLGLFFLCVTAQGALTLSDWWLSQWSSLKGEELFVFRSIKSKLSSGRPSNTTDTQKLYIIVYGGLVAATLLLSFLRAILFFHITVNSSKVLFNRMFEAVMRAPIYFFDTTPIGRILNRFSSDTTYMDNLIPETFFDFLQLALLAVAVVIVNVSAIPFVLVGLVPLFLVFYCLRNYFLKTTREIKRLEATGRSPMLSHVTASLQGLSSIRAHNSQDLLIHEFNRCQDHHTEAWFLFVVTSRWFAYRLDILCLLFVFMASFTPVFIAETQDIDAGIVGLCLTYALLLTGMFQWCVRQSAEVENQMTAVERIIEHCNLEPEGEWCVKSACLPYHWPELGLITAEGVSYKHHPSLPRVLKNLNFCIRPKEKVGIVGRTGAGKSSLLSALLRLAEPSGGTVRIDGIDITEIGLHDLRSKLSVIPQDPVLFSGTLRRNLDPFDEYCDLDVLVALHEVQLKDAVGCLLGGLDAQLTEGGSNFSVGQRQLICLARAILTGNRILVMDEATANVDQSTDALIQETLRRKFRNCTVLIIAHRLKTIVDCDRVMVLDNGRLKEFEEPHLLLQNKYSYFYKLVEQTGSISAAQLVEVARKAYEQRHKPQTHESVPDEVRTHLSSYIPVSGFTDLQLVSNL